MSALLCTFTKAFVYFTGVISLPYAEIKEPFEAWFDTAGKASRIDYYYGKNTSSTELNSPCKMSL